MNERITEVGVEHPLTLPGSAKNIYAKVFNCSKASGRKEDK